MKYQITLICALVVVAACANFGKHDREAREALDSGAMKVSYQVGGSLASDEQVIAGAIRQYIQFKDVWGALNGYGLDLTDTGLLMIGRDFEALRESFYELEKIVAINFDDYDETKQGLLNYYRREARSVEGDMAQGYTISGITRYADVVLRISANIL